MAALAGFLFVASAGVARGTNIREDVTDLPALVSAEQERLDRTKRTTERLGQRIDELTALEGDTNEGVAEALDETDALGPAAGFTEVRGQGVVVVLDDALGDAATRAENPDLLVVHQQDVQGVVNAMWEGGAEGVMLMDQRLISTSAFRCVGNTLSVHGTPYSPPYRITAVGDPDRILAALEASPDVQTYRQYERAYGLGYQVQTDDDLVLLPYEQPTSLRYARVAPKTDT